MFCFSQCYTVFLLCVTLCNLPFTPDGTFDVVSISQDDSHDFVADVGHTVVCHGAELRDG